jgi:hypothetical protein
VRAWGFDARHASKPLRELCKIRGLLLPLLLLLLLPLPLLLQLPFPLQLQLLVSARHLLDGT